MKAAALLLAGLAAASAYNLTELDEFIAAPDDTYEWYDMNSTLDGPGWTAHLVNLTSQTWLTAEDSSQPVWWHVLAIIVPDNLSDKASSYCGLWVTGGKNNGALPQVTDEDMLVSGALAVGQGVIVGSLFQIPNAPIVFATDPLQKSRTEDAIIAFTWNHYVNVDNEDYRWPLHLPMTKATIRAMDTIEAWMALDKHQGKFLAKPEDAEDIKWIVAGASKRGWTTWLTAAAVPERLAVAVPIVLDYANTVPNLHHQWMAYGGWTWAFKDYYEMNFTKDLDNPNTQKMFDFCDPMVYFDRFTEMHKFVVNTGMDEFMMPDDDWFWWDMMPEPKHRLMLPNTEHSMATGILEAVPAINAYCDQVLHDKTLPSPTWTMSDDKTTITLDAGTDPAPIKVDMWWASSECTNTRRDFRIATADDPCECGIGSDGYCTELKSFWSHETLTEDSSNPGVYVGTQVAPEDGWTAFFLDVTYDKDDSTTVKRVGDWPVDRGLLDFTTQVGIVPNTFPFEDCTGEECMGTLV